MALSLCAESAPLMAVIAIGAQRGGLSGSVVSGARLALSSVMLEPLPSERSGLLLSSVSRRVCPALQRIYAVDVMWLHSRWSAILAF